MEFNFDFDRAVMFRGAHRSADGKFVVIERMPHSKPVSVSAKKVQTIRTLRLRGSNCRVVDFGPLGEQTDNVIIAAGRKDRFPAL